MKITITLFKHLFSLCNRFLLDFRQTKESLNRGFEQYPYIDRACRLIKMLPGLIVIFYLVDLGKLMLFLLLLEGYAIFVGLLFTLIWKLILVVSKSQHGIKSKIQIIAKRTLYDSEENMIFSEGEVIAEFDYLQGNDPYDLYYFVYYNVSEYLPSADYKGS